MKVCNILDIISTITYPMRIQGSFKLSLSLLHQLLFNINSNNLICGMF